MNLTERIAKINRIGDDKLIVEFDNGFGVAYERREGSITQEVLDGIDSSIVDIIKKKSRCVAYRELVPGVSTRGAKDLYGKRQVNFSQEMDDLLATPQTMAEKQVHALEDKINNCYDAIVAPLQVQKYYFRDWNNIISNLKEIGLFAGLTAIWPLSMLYIMCGGMKKSSPGFGDLAKQLVMMAPIVLLSGMAYAVKNIISPQDQALKIRNTKILTKQKNKDTAYLLFSSVSFKATLSRFNHMNIVLQNGISLSEGEIITQDINMNKQFFCQNAKRCIRVQKNNNWFDNQKLDNQKWYFNVDEKLQKDISAAVEEKESIIKSSEDFYKELTKDNQIAMLKSIGFLK